MKKSSMCKISPFALAYGSVEENGYSVLPIIPRQKCPGVFSQNQWFPMKNWTQYSQKKVDDDLSGLWQKWNGAGIGVIMGYNTVVALDYDTDDPEILEILKFLPQSPIKKRGGRGFSTFFRDPTGTIASEKWLVNQECVFEILSKGRQSIIPPSIHPGTEKPYYYMSEGTFENTDINDLPILPPDINQKISDALETIQGKRHPKKIYPIKAIYPTFHAEQGDFFSINSKALQYLDRWVPSLPLYGLERKQTGYMCVASWRSSGSGRPLDQRKKNLHIVNMGIKDFGDDQGYSPLDLVMAAKNISFLEAVFWLGQIVDPIVEWSFTTPSAPQNDDAYEISQIIASPTPSVVSKNNKVNQNIDPLDKEICKVPGLVGEISDWVLRTSSHRIPIFALTAAVSYISALIGRKYMSPTKAHPNMYIIHIGQTGIGKAHAFNALKELDSEADLRILGPEEYTSGSAFVRVLSQKPSLLALIDEFGDFAEGMTDRRAGQHMKDCATTLTKLYDKSQTSYLGKARASKDDSIDTIHFPNFNLLGATTQHAMFDGITTKAIERGLAGRLTPFECPKRPADHKSEDIPPSPLLIEKLRMMKTSFLNERSQNASQRPALYKVPWGDGAEKIYDTLRKEQNKIMDNDPVYGLIAARLALTAQKFAMIRAVGINPLEPVIEKADMVWGSEMAQLSAQNMTDGVMKYMVGSEFEKNCKVVLSEIESLSKTKKFKNKTIPKNALLNRKRVAALTDKELDGVIKRLIDQKLIFINVKNLNTGKTGVSYSVS